MPSSSVLRRDLEIPFAGYPVDWAGKPLWMARERICLVKMILN